MLHPAEPSLKHAESLHQFQILIDDEVIGRLDYEIYGRSARLIHTEVNPEFRGRQYASLLTAYTIRTLLDQGLAIVAACPFVVAYLKRHPLPEK
jgi:hypothetical protein